MSTIQSGKNILVTVIAAEVSESKNTSTPGVFFTFENDEGKINGNLWLSGGAYENSLNRLRKAFAFNDDFPSLPEQVIGKQCMIEVEIEEYKDKSYPKVKWINAVQTAAKPAAGDLLARLTKLAKETPRPADAPKPNPKVTPKPAPAPAAAPVADDECPY
jgi:hypothetical protein